MAKHPEVFISAITSELGGYGKSKDQMLELCRLALH
jgi:hypothetical protein